VLEQTGEVLYGNRRFRIPPVVVRVKKPRGLLKAHLVAEGVFKPVMIGEVFQPHSFTPTNRAGELTPTKRRRSRA
jgi:hypothetical protein